MVTYIDSPSAPGRIAYILSTISKRVSITIDPSFPTHYNLLTIDMPGHGLTHRKEPLEGEMTWKRIGIIFHEALQALGVEKMVESLIMINPLGQSEPESVLMEISEWFAVQAEVVESKDPQLIDILNTILVDLVTGQMSNWIIRDVCDSLANLAKVKLFRGEYVGYHSVFTPLLTSSFAAPSTEELSKIAFPTLIVDNVILEGQDHDAGDGVWIEIVGKLNILAASRGKPPLATRHALVGEVITKYNATSRWTTLTHPELLTSLKNFSDNTASSSVFRHTESLLGRCQPIENEIVFDLGDMMDFLLEASAASSS
ncbi:hypothetical protein IAR50_001411 [Cryptococcus sp. DSM 104548]